MSDLSIRLLSSLAYGKANAITGRQLANRFGFKDDRIIREAIRELIALGWPVASSVNGTKGYFLANTEDEVTEYINVTRSRLIEDAKRIRDFKRATRVIREPHQLQMSMR